MKGIIRRAFTENAALKAVAFILAVTLFILVRGDKETERYLRVSVAYVKPKGQTLIGDVPATVEVRVRGPWTRIKRLDASDVDPILVDLTRAPEGDLPILDDMIHLPPGLRVASVKPSKITVTYQREKELPIVPTWDGKPAQGFRIDRPDHPLTTPPTITLRGPKSVLDPLTQVQTLPISVAGKDEPFRVRVGLAPLPEGTSLSGNVDDVEVEVPITEELGKRILAHVPVEVRPPLGTTFSGRYPPPDVQPAEVQIVLTGQRVAIAEVKQEEVKAVVEAVEPMQPHPAVVVVEGIPRGVQVEVTPRQVLMIPGAGK